MLKQSSLGESAHWALSFAAELRVEARLPAAAYSTDGEETHSASMRSFKICARMKRFTLPVAVTGISSMISMRSGHRRLATWRSLR